MKRPLTLATCAIGAMLAGAAYAQQATPGDSPSTTQVQQRSESGDQGRDESRPRWRRDREGRGDWREGMRERMADRCGRRAERFGERAVERIERATRPTTEQRPAFDKLKEASTKAAEIVKAACPTERSLTPPGRLANAEKRLAAMLEAIRTVRPAMDAYYGTLTDEQKARLTVSRRAMMEPRGERSGWRERGERHHGRRDEDRGESRHDRFGDHDQSDDHGGRNPLERTGDVGEEL
jgi:hypothetical protein